jgi:glycosyltransferase involved in cell wall biosynthesis
MKAPPDGRLYPFPVTYLGVLDDDKAIARAYSAADVLVVPSIEDNLPNSVMEAGSCGVPCVAFRTGGLPDLIEHAQSGYLAEPFDIEDLAAGVSSLISEPYAAAEAGRFARQHVIANYSYSVVARQHEELYSKLLGS